MLDRTIKMNGIISRIDFIDKQNQTDNNYKFLLIYQDLKKPYCLLRPLTSICAKEVANVLIDIFSTLEVPGILKCKGDTIFPSQLASYLYNQEINIIIICENIEIYNFKHPTEDITKVISEMLDTWLTINETNKWSEGLDIIQFQKNHNIYFEATHVPINFNNFHSLKSICNMNTHTKYGKTTSGNCGENILENFREKTSVDDKTEIDPSLILDHEEDNVKYEILEEILSKLVNPISSLMEMHDKYLPQLLQKPARECSITEALHEHDKCSEFNTTSEEELPKLIQEVAQEYPNLQCKMEHENCLESNTNDKEDFPQLVKEVAQECSKLESN